MAPDGNQQLSPKAIKERRQQALAIALANLVVVLFFWKSLHSSPLPGTPAFQVRQALFGTNGLQTAASWGAGVGSSSTPDENSPPGLLSTTNTSPTASSLETNSPAPPRPPPTSEPAVVTDDLVLSNSEARVVGLESSEALTNSPEAAALALRLDQAGAKGGDIQFSIMWHNYNDLDLHCTDPANIEISFVNKKSSQTGGELDLDRNAHAPFYANPAENIFWPVRGAPPGRYKVFVVFYAQHGPVMDTPFIARAVVQGQTNYFQRILHHPTDRVWICTINYDPQNPDPAQRHRFLANP
jgi:hypothetical protein